MKRLVTLVSAIMALGACGKVLPAPGTESPGLCGESLVSCDNQCVDPSRDPDFCGARAGCAGLDAGKVCQDGFTCIQGECAELPPGDLTSCINCSFEQAELGGWVIRDILDPTFPVSATGAGVDPYGFFSSQPTDGSLALVTGFDGWGPGVISASQVLDVPAAREATLSFDYRAAWDLKTYGATRDRSFTVAISLPDGKPLLAQTILTAKAATLRPDTGLLTGTVDLTPHTGQQIDIEFLWDVPEDHSGPSFFQLDNVRIQLR